MQETLDLKDRPLWSLAGISTWAEEDTLPTWSRKSPEVAVGTPTLPTKGRGWGRSEFTGKTCHFI